MFALIIISGPLADFLRLSVCAVDTFGSPPELEDEVLHWFRSIQLSCGSKRMPLLVFLLLGAGCAVEDNNDRGFVRSGSPQGSESRAASPALGAPGVDEKGLADLRSESVVEVSQGNTVTTEVPPDRQGGLANANTTPSVAPAQDYIPVSAGGSACRPLAKALRQAVIVSSNGVNVRSAPGQGAGRIDGFDHGVTLSVWSTSEAADGASWSCATGQDPSGKLLTGWVSSDLLKAQP